MVLLHLMSGLIVIASEQIYANGMLACHGRPEMGLNVRDDGKQI